MEQKKDPKQSYIENYQILETLGKGATAKVKLAQDIETKQKVALKIFRDPKESKMKLKHDFERVKKEFEIIQHLHHPNILNVIKILNNAIYENQSKGKKYITTTIVIEFADGGELFDYAATYKGLKEQISRTYFRQYIDGLEYLHKNNVTHRDIKMENVIFDGEFNLKIADFGFARNMDGNDHDGKLHTRLGTEGYQAYEIKNKKEYQGDQVDIFASGYLLFVMTFGRPPFNAASAKDQWYLCFIQQKEKFWQYQRKHNNISQEYQQLIDGMMSHKPDQRLTIAQIRENAWFKGPVSTQQELFQYMDDKNKAIKQNLKKEREQEKIKKQQKQQQEQQQQQKQEQAYPKNYQFRGGNEVHNNLASLQSIYQPKQLEFQDKTLKTCTTVQNGDLVFAKKPQDLFLDILDKFVSMCTETPILHESKYRMQGFKIIHEEQISLEINLFELEGQQEDSEYSNGEIKVQFIKLEGDNLEYHKLINKLKDDLQISIEN